MSVWVIIPVKPLKLAKSRLAAVISPDQRQEFAQTLLRHTLEVVQNVPTVTGTLVISRDTKALSIARDYKAYTVMESGTPELNAALMRATQVVAGWHAEAVLILPSDLPLLASEDVSSMIAMGREHQTVVIATDQHEDGTNAMMVRPAGLFPYAYGPGSYHRHIDLAKQSGAAVKAYHSERMLLDIDLPEDLERYLQLSTNDSEMKRDLWNSLLSDNAS
ncbi:MAG: 2-phospho-L-lactate guanylyltransferase [Anaerolineae bacterium]